jgi:hypothetical protein
MKYLEDLIYEFFPNPERKEISFTVALNTRNTDPKWSRSNCPGRSDRWETLQKVKLFRTHCPVFRPDTTRDSSFGKRAYIAA